MDILVGLDFAEIGQKAIIIINDITEMKTREKMTFYPQGFASTSALALVVLFLENILRNHFDAEP